MIHTTVYGNFTLYCFWPIIDIWGSQKETWILFQWNWMNPSCYHWNWFPIGWVLHCNNSAQSDMKWFNLNEYRNQPKPVLYKRLISTIYILGRLHPAAFQALVLDKCNFIDCFPSGGPRSIGICEFGNGNGTLAPLSKKFDIKAVQICSPSFRIEKYF